jgi:hypothetical protein
MIKNENDQIAEAQKKLTSLEKDNASKDYQAQMKLFKRKIRLAKTY